jgi:hypothetical protein
MNLNTKINRFLCQMISYDKEEVKMKCFFFTLKMTRKTHINLERFLVSV